MSLKTRTELKAYLETGDYPTQAEFINIIDSLLNIKDDGCLQGGATNITAFSGGGQGSAWQLTMKNNRVTVVAAPGDSVKLPSGIAGMTLFVYNTGANACDVFPSSGEYINLLAVDTAISLMSNSHFTFLCYTAGYWKIG